MRFFTTKLVPVKIKQAPWYFMFTKGGRPGPYIVPLEPLVEPNRPNLMIDNGKVSVLDNIWTSEFNKIHEQILEANNEWLSDPDINKIKPFFYTCTRSNNS